MPALPWRGGLPPAPVRVRVERFSTQSIKHRVWFLDDCRILTMHFCYREASIPCFAPSPCPCCDDPRWKKRTEGFAAVLIRNDREHRWEPAVAVLTHGAMKQIGNGPHRGIVCNIRRVMQGNQKIPKVEVLPSVDPPIPAFDIEPHLHAMWFPADSAHNAADVPEPIPFEPEAKPQVVAEPMRSIISPEQQAKLIADLEARGLVNMANRLRQQVDPAAAASNIPANATNPKRTPAAEEGPSVLKIPVNGSRVRVPSGTAGESVISAKTEGGRTKVVIESSYPNPPTPAEKGAEFIRQKIKQTVGVLGAMPGDDDAQPTAPAKRKGGAA